MCETGRIFSTKEARSEVEGGKQKREFRELAFSREKNYCFFASLKTPEAQSTKRRTLTHPHTLTGETTGLERSRIVRGSLHQC